MDLDAPFDLAADPTAAEPAHLAAIQAMESRSRMFYSRVAMQRLDGRVVTPREFASMVVGVAEEMAR